MKKLIAILSLLSLSSAAAAEFPTGKVGLSLSPKVDLELEGIPDGDGNALGFYGEFGSDMIFGYGDLRASDVDVEGVDIEIDETRFGLGIRGGNDTGYLEARVEQYEAEFDIEGVSQGDNEDDGLGAHIGGGVPLGANANLFGRFGFLSLDDLDGNEFQLGLSGEMGTNLEVYGLYRMLNLEDDANDELDLSEFRLGLNLLF